jgi:DNA-binding CsgD family transcriptional regulator
MAAIAGQRGDLAGAQRLGEAALAIMRGIDQQWGVARTLLGLGDLARLTGDAHGARRRYEEALAILREVNARPEMARCLAGLGRIAMDRGEVALGRQHLTQSIELSRSIGSRIGTIRGVEAFAALALAEGQPERALRLAAAAAALRAAAHLPPRPDAWTDRYLAAAQDLGQGAIRRLWEQGSGLDAGAAVDLALGGAPPPDAGGSGGTDAAPAGKLATPGGLTPRELEIATLIARGQSNKAIGQELVISPATAARHVANIMLKLGFSSRSQIAAWAVRESGSTAAGGRGRGKAGPQSP